MHIIKHQTVQLIASKDDTLGGIFLRTFQFRIRNFLS